LEDLEYCLGAASPAEGKEIITSLSPAGLRCTGEAGDCPQFLRTVRKFQPQVTILSLELKGDVLETASIIDQESLAALLLVTRENTESTFYQKMKQQFPYIQELPVESNVLLTAIKVLYLEHLRRKQLNEELHNLRSRLQARTVIERAKGVVMKELSLDEQSAYRFMQKKSMDLRLPLKDYAERLLKTM